MKRQNKLAKRIRIIVILLILLATAMQPLNSYAAELENTEPTINIDVEKPEENPEEGLLPFDAALLEEGVPETQAEDPSYTAEITFYELNESGDGYDWIEDVVKENVKIGQTLREIGVTFPEMGSKYPSFTQVGWMEYTGTDITEDRQIMEYDLRKTSDGTSKIYIYIYRKYDKGMMIFAYRYPDNEGGWSSSVNPVIYEYGETYENLKNKAMEYRPENMTKEYPFSHWEQNYTYKELGDIPVGVNYVGFVARMAEIEPVEIQYLYYNKNGEFGSNKFIAAAEGSNMTVSDVEKMIAEQGAPESYPGLRVERWDVSSGVVQSHYAVNKCFYARAIYENCLVRYIIKDSDTGEQSVFCQVAEKGETVTAMTSFEGFEEVTWKNQPEATFVVNEHMEFTGTASSAKPSTTAGLQIDPIVTDKVYVIGSGTGAVIKCTGELKDFVSIAIDDVVLASSDYTVVSGSTVITIMSSYLDKLSVGRHKVTLNYTYGSVDTTLLVLDRDMGGMNTGSIDGIIPSGTGSQEAGNSAGSTSENTYSKQKAPKTGEGSNLPWIVAMTVFGMGYLFLAKYQNESKN